MSNIWDIYTSKKEYEFELKDKFDRTLTNYTTDSDILKPVVSMYLKDKGFAPKYPDGKSFATCISHDIDNLYSRSGKIQLVKSALRLDVKSLFRQMASRRKRIINPDYDLNNILGIDNHYGVKASYYFLSTTEDNPEDHNYYLEEIKDYFPQLRSHGHELGLHGSKLVSADQGNMHIEKERLEKHISEVNGYRSHFLKFQVPTTWNILASEGFTYDTTFGAASCPGFRNGMCYPFRPYDRNANRWIDIYEIPLVAMDVSFFRYLNLTYDSAFELFKILVQKVKDCNGVFSFLWHNNYVKGEMRDFYEKCLQYLNEEKTWFSTGEQMIDWWKENDYFDQQQDLLKETIS